MSKYLCSKGTKAFNAADRMIRRSGRAKKLAYTNDLSAWVPQFWANESLMILTENLFAPGLVHRDFENLVASKGDTVKTRRPNLFAFNRKTDATNVTVQDLTATNVNVPLDQHIEVTFKVRDEEWSKGLPSMVETHIKPAVIQLARSADQIIFGQVHRHMKNAVGGLGQMTSANAKDFVINTRELMNNNKVPEQGRNLVLSVAADATMLRPEWFTSVSKVGETQGIREAQLGRLLGFDFMRSNNIPQIVAGNTVVSGAINLSGGYSKGATVLVVDGFTGDLPAGSFITVDGLPNQIVSTTLTTGNCTGITLLNPLTRSVANDTAVVNYTPAAVNNSGGYTAGYEQYITVNGTTQNIQVGQAISFGTVAGTDVYTVVASNGLTSILLDRPLAANVANSAAVNIGPAGSFSYAFYKDVLAFVNRPLATPPANMGVFASVMNTNNIAIRVIMQYNASGQFTQVTLDMLCGVQVLNVDLGAILVS